jgi:hypothetical protein
VEIAVSLGTCPLRADDKHQRQLAECRKMSGR